MDLGNTGRAGRRCEQEECVLGSLAQRVFDDEAVLDKPFGREGCGGLGLREQRRAEESKDPQTHFSFRQ